MGASLLSLREGKSVQEVLIKLGTSLHHSKHLRLIFNFLPKHHQQNTRDRRISGAEDPTALGNTDTTVKENVKNLLT